MFKTILVPLDRSSFAEQALPYALSIARRGKAQLDIVEVHALSAFDDPAACWMPYDPVQDFESQREEQLYLDATARWIESISPVAASTAVLAGSAVLPSTVADSILERAEAGQADLIVMATHGRSPASRIGIGSVADELIRRASVPILLVRPSGTNARLAQEPFLDNLLIPLDGSALAESVLPSATDLAVAMEAQCCLLCVVEFRGAKERTQADEYLNRVAAGLRDRGVEVLTRMVVARPTAEAILEEAEAQGSSLIALATHGRGGLKRLLLGSVADKLVRSAVCPILVYRPTGTKTSE